MSENKVDSEPKEQAPESLSESKEYFTVQAVYGFKFDGELKFLLKWQDYPFSHNSFEVTANLIECDAFEKYIDNLYDQLQADIEDNNKIMNRKLREEISSILSTSTKKKLLKRIEKFEIYEFKAYQAMCHLVKLSAAYYKIFDKLFIDNAIVALKKRQDEEFNKIQRAIQSKTFYTVTLTNDIDFSYPPNFTYITENVSDNPITNPLRSCSSLTASQISGIILGIFKKKNLGWGLKTLKALPRGSIVVDCVGEMLTPEQTAEKTDKAFIFPTKLETTEGNFYIDSSMYGNASRFINHNCKPNCSIICEPSQFHPSHNNLLVVTSCRIESGEELTIDFDKGVDKSFHNTRRVGGSRRRKVRVTSHDLQVV